MIRISKWFPENLLLAICRLVKQEAVMREIGSRRRYDFSTPATTLMSPTAFSLRLTLPPSVEHKVYNETWILGQSRSVRKNLNQKKAEYKEVKKTCSYAWSRPTWTHSNNGIWCTELTHPSQRLAWVPPPGLGSLVLGISLQTSSLVLLSQKCTLLPQLAPLVTLSPSWWSSQPQKYLRWWEKGKIKPPETFYIFHKQFFSQQKIFSQFFHMIKVN